MRIRWMNSRQSFARVMMASVAVAGLTSSLACDDRASPGTPSQPGAPFVLVQLSPASGEVSGGTIVTLEGVGFQEGAIVTFGKTVLAHVTVNGPTSITVTAPANPDEGLVNITVVNPDGRQRFLNPGFRYYDPLKACNCGWGVP